jgi:hypothetical protein
MAYSRYYLIICLEGLRKSIKKTSFGIASVLPEIPTELFPIYKSQRYSYTILFSLFSCDCRLKTVSELSGGSWV